MSAINLREIPTSPDPSTGEVIDWLMNIALETRNLQHAFKCVAAARKLKEQQAAMITAAKERDER